MPPITVEDLWKIALHDPLVKSFLTAWQTGRFSSFESMLIAMNVDQARVREADAAELLRLRRLLPPQPIIRE